MRVDLSSIEAVFSEALEILEGSARAQYLDRACEGDAELREQVESLLSMHDRAGRFLESPTVGEADRPLESPGTVIGPYQLMEQIGEGGMGVVYVAEQAEPVRRKVALKVIKPGMDSKQVIARFEAERQALALMDHPNIAKVLDAGTTPPVSPPSEGGAWVGGRPYFVMELVRGLPITEYCDREQLSIPERLELFVLVCRAVQHAHQKGIIHRDLKPSNILVTVIDGAAVPKVIDFGVAKATGASLTERTLYTGFHQFVGTPLYMSPEQAELSGVDIDTRSDIYSLGVLLYELLTGTTPFDSETLKRAAFDEMRRIIREEEPPKPSTRLSSLGETLSTVSARRSTDPRRLGPSMKGELDWVVMKALEKDRRRRYETANAFAADVLRHLADEPVEACPPSACYRLRKFARRNRLSLAAAATIGLALVAGTAVSTWQAVWAMNAERRAKSDRLRAENRSRQTRRAVDEMYTQVAEKWLAEQPRLTSLQREFLEKALVFYQGFLTDADAEWDVQQELALAALRVGRIRHALGQHMEAEAALRQALEQSARLSRQAPEHTDLVRTVLIIRSELAKLLGATGRLGEAESELRQAVADGTRLRNRATASVRYELARVHRALGNVLKDVIGRRGEAEPTYRTAVEFAAALVADCPGTAEYRFELVKSTASLGNRLTFTAKYEEAERLLRNGLEHLTILERDHSRDLAYREAFSQVQSCLGSVLRGMGRHEESLGSFRRSVQAREALVADFPDVLKYQEELAASFNNMSSSFKGLGRKREWEEYIRKAIAVEERLVDQQPDVPEYRYRVSCSTHNLINVYSERRDFREIRRILEKLLPQEEAMIRAEPLNQLYSGIHVNHIARWCANAIELGDHLAAAQGAEDLARRKLADKDQNRAAIVLRAGWLMTRCNLLAEHDVALSLEQRREVARGYTVRAQSLFQEAIRLAGDSAMDLAGLAQIRATVEIRELRDFVQALEHAKRAVSLEPKNAVTWQMLGLAEYRNDHFDAAIAAEKKGLELITSKDDGLGLLVLALAEARRGERSQARQWFDRAEKVRQDIIARTGRSWDKVISGGAAMHVLYDEAAALLGTEVNIGAKARPGPNSSPSSPPE